MERLEGLNGQWLTAALNAYKKPLLRPEGALEPLLVALRWKLHAELAHVGLVGVPCPCVTAMRTFGAFGGFWRV